MKKQKHKSLIKNPLSSIEWNTCWMAIRYAMSRQTISSTSLPGELVESYYHRWTVDQKMIIAKDLRAEEARVAKVSDGRTKAFGNSRIDRPKWLKLWRACDII